MNKEMSKEMNKTSNIYSSYFEPMITEESELNLQVKSLFDKFLEERIIFISGPITDSVAAVVTAQLLYLDTISNEDIHIYINSPGGEVYSGLAIYDIMNYVQSKVITTTIGLAASMAFIIAISGDQRNALPNARYMQHQPMSGLDFGQVSDFEIQTKELQTLQTKLYNIIAEKTGQDFDKVKQDCDRDYWMSAEEGKEYGAIDFIRLKKNVSK